MSLYYDIVETLFPSYAKFDKLPWQLREHHVQAVDDCIEAGLLDLTPEERYDEIERRCHYTLQQINKRSQLSCYQICRYYYTLFHRLACVIESTLLEYHCKKDLFGYQVSYEIILAPSLSAVSVADERNWSVEYVIELADGYDFFDRFTEFAGYGNVGNKLYYQGIDFVKIPEIDALLLQLNENRAPDYPGHHSQRNYRRFERRCIEFASSDTSYAQKKAWVVSLVQLLGSCYKSFLANEKKQHYSIYAMSYFFILESAFLKSPVQICLKEICQDLSLDCMLKDPFPEGYRAKHNYLTADEPWEHYLITRKLRSQYEYQAKRVCMDCKNQDCAFRFSLSKQPVLIASAVLSAEDKKKLFRKNLRIVCKDLTSQSGSKVVAGDSNGTWKLPHAGSLYAYIGIALKEHLHLSQVPWKEMFDILITDSDSSYLKGRASVLSKAIKNNKLSDLPVGYKDVDAAIGRLSA